ncbi:protoheme IX farnesyltransferase [Marinicauda salina]|uniref:Protoheme IX farnesyltransferase n=1 Tax=Marinicauda salina TaxID=2135793 RepID=A0A2U2BUJ4_9PROT|nr:protoheme IX farnesyltransferase [Marinicauda salina]PWE17659.1 protoheme IX farnesyltransferase [Marinicauda salina]
MTEREPEPAAETETVKLTEAEKRARGRRNQVIAWSLVGFIVLVFVVTVVRLSANIASGG